MKNYFLVFLSIITFFSCTTLKANDPLVTVNLVKVQSYTGKWYEVSRLPNRFQKNCQQSTAVYEILNSDTISVLNTCFKKNGKISTIKGEGKITNAPSNSKLLIQFKTWYSWLIPKGTYWILDLVENNNTYEFSLVGTPDRKFLWILARSPNPSLKKVNELKQKAQSLGFNIDKMIDNF